SEHLDWHTDQAEYWAHKGNIAARQGEKDLFVYCADAAGSAWMATRTRARKIGFGAQAEVRIADGAATWVTRGLTIPLASTRLKGEFNLENVAAAGTIALELGADPQAVKKAAETFNGLEHRLEFVREARGI